MQRENEHLLYTLCLKKTCTLRQVGINYVIFQIQKNPKYTFCRKFHSEWKLWVLLWKWRTKLLLFPVFFSESNFTLWTVSKMTDILISYLGEFLRYSGSKFSGGASTSKQPGHFQVTKVLRQVIPSVTLPCPPFPARAKARSAARAEAFQPDHLTWRALASRRHCQSSILSHFSVTRHWPITEAAGICYIIMQRVCIQSVLESVWFS